MFKTLTTSLFLLLTFTAFSQSTLQVKKDTVTVKGAEFAIENKTRYRFEFNGKENDNEVKREANQQDYGMRIYDPRVGRF